MVRDGTETLSSVVASQVDLHALYGGVVPELASREHLRNIVPVVREAMAKADGARRVAEAFSRAGGCPAGADAIEGLLGPAALPSGAAWPTRSTSSATSPTASRRSP